MEIVYRTRAALADALSRHPARLVRVVAPLHAAEVQPASPAAPYARAVGAEPGVEAARPTARRTSTEAPALALGQVSTPDGGAYEWQYYVTHANLVPADVLAAASRITIAVVDTGVDGSASGLASKIVGSFDVRTGRRAAPDRVGHGTFVASLAAGAGGDGGGVVGFGGGARLLVVKVGDSTSFDDVSVAAGIVYAVRHGARVVNLSMAGKRPSPVEARAVAYAAERGVLLVAAAGNDGLAGNPVEYPAAYLQPVGSEGLGGSGLAVGASDPSGGRATFSESGSFLSLAAPGADVFGARPSRATASASPQGGAGAYGFASGTSFAAPEVAGAAALVWAANPRLTAGEVAEILKATASGDGVWNPELGYGVVDVAAAVAKAKSS